MKYLCIFIVSFAAFSVLFSFINYDVEINEDQYRLLYYLSEHNANSIRVKIRTCMEDGKIDNREYEEINSMPEMRGSQINFVKNLLKEY